LEKKIERVLDIAIGGGYIYILGESEVEVIEIKSV
jgi:hypothetical protein